MYISMNAVHKASCTSLLIINHTHHTHHTQGKLDPSVIITHEFPLEEAPEAYRMFNDKVVCV